MYRTIHTELWTDDKVIALDPLGKLLFLYLITNPHAHLSGLYYLPKSFIIEETGMSGRSIDTLLHTLSIPYLIKYDERLRVVLVVNMFEYQAKGPKNLKCAASHLLTLHNSPLIHAFIKRYPEITPFVSDTLSDTLSIGDTSTPVPDPVPDLLTPSLLIRSNPNLKSKTDTQDFEFFWSAYPKKVGKKAAFEAFRKATDRPDVRTMVEVIVRSQASEQWTKDNGQFIPHPATWLKQGRWADQVQQKPMNTMDAFLARGATHDTNGVCQGMAVADHTTVGQGIPDADARTGRAEHR